ncbi:hypothetical protein J2752_002038 [Halarchaeum rubridurum]|uniref:Flagellin N-terminal-like domain-containing protein n=1 Tax=Halarchaeum rubridurum TaxID=489911 RepID=A0A830G0D1_9EURY|nr:type IV pilin [Halarchaeum rubridurum]MBP1955126.1 hypothetical protein [Halarchaeum rubridurum]GGM68759.1 hypothetical protein GCM10009017_18690 [Halarchaeum rubridurum]
MSARLEGESATCRGQSHVVGVALLCCVAVVSMAAVTGSVGGVVGETAANADATRVADALDGAVGPTVGTGHATRRVPFAAGRLHTAARDVRVLDANGTVARYRTNAVTFDAANRGVTSVAGTTVVRTRGWARVTGPVRATAVPDALVLDLVVVEGDVDVSGRGGGATLRTDTTVTRETLAGGTYRLAVETRHPEAFARRYGRDGVPGAVVGERDFDGDGIESVVVAYPPAARAYVVVRTVEVAV